MPFWATAILAVLVVAALAAALALRAWLKYRGDRVIVCPENHRPAGVALDARHAAAVALWNGGELRLSSCSRWPEKSGCGQECLSQIEASPEGCLVRHILTGWYQGKVCAWCGRPWFRPMRRARAGPWTPGGRACRC